MVVLTNTSIPSDTIKLTQSSVQVYAGQESLGNGTLYVSESTLAWITNDNKGFELNYRSIILHAISTDLTNFAQEHIYVLVDNNKAEQRRRRAPVLLTQHEAQISQDIQMANNELNGAGDEEDVEDDDSEAGKSIEFRLVPDNKDSLSEIYHEICVCQELNPEEDESFSEDEMDYEGEELSNGINGGGNQWITAENNMQSRSVSNSSSEESIFNEQTRKLFKLCDAENLGFVTKTDLTVLADLLPPDDLRRLEKFIGEQKVNESAFCRILKAIVSQSMMIKESENFRFDESKYLKEPSLEDEMNAIEKKKSYIEDPVTEMLQKELEEIRKYEESQMETTQIVIKKPLFRPIQEPTFPRVSSLADELNAAEKGLDSVREQEESEEELAQPDRIFKVVFVGDSAVGKTCFLHRFCHNRFKPLFNATIGVDFTVKTMRIHPGRTIAMQLWDTAGQERFRSITKQYFRKADGVVLMFDVTSEQSFLNVRNWISSVRAGVDETSVMCLVGNKVDLFGSDMTRSSVYKAGDKLAREFNIPFFETSAYTGYGIDACMRRMAECLQRREDNHLEQALKLDLQPNVKGRSWCCI